MTFNLIFRHCFENGIDGFALKTLQFVKWTFILTSSILKSITKVATSEIFTIRKPYCWWFQSTLSFCHCKALGVFEAFQLIQNSDLFWSSALGFAFEFFIVSSQEDKEQANFSAQNRLSSKIWMFKFFILASFMCSMLTNLLTYFY